ncbi:MAG: hypothetical protein ACKVHU_20890 [Acidimicrobiales bacterium]|jgi:hypothetical protein
MGDEVGFYDEFGFYSPQPIDRATRRQPGLDHPTGPAVGESVPAVLLPNQSNVLIDVQASLGSAGAIVVFHRSAYW